MGLYKFLLLMLAFSPALLSAQSTTDATLRNDAPSDNKQQPDSHRDIKTEDLPDPTARWTDWTLLQSNATAYPGDDSNPDLQSQLLHRGLGGTHTQVTIDGMDATVAFLQQERGRSFGHASLFPGAVQDMSFSSANSGMGAVHTRGMRSSASTFSGTRRFHGQAFLNNRHNLFAAANPYAQLPVLSAGVWHQQPVNPPSTRVEWGLSSGGPVTRVERLYWFLAYDGLSYNHPGVARALNFTKFFTPPTQQQMQDLGARLNTTTGLATDLYNSQLQLIAAEELGIVPRQESDWSLLPRLDWSPNKHDHFAAEMSLADTDSPGGARTGRTATYGTTSFGNRSSVRTLGLVRWQRQFTPHLIQQFAAQYSSDLESESHQQPNNFENSFLSNAWGLLPQVAVAPSYGLTLGKPAALDRRAYPGERQMQFDESLLWARGRRTLHLGIHYRYVSDDIDYLENQTGSYSYASLPNFISDLLAYKNFGLNWVGQNDNLVQHACPIGSTVGLGYKPCYSWYTQSTGPTEWNFNTADWAGFATAEWRVNDRLTLSTGLRYQFQQIPNQPANLVNPDIPGTSRMPHDGNNLAPSIGLAWRPFGKHETVLHAGLGLFYGRTPNATILAGLNQTGSAKGQQNYFFRPDDDGAPYFPYVFPQTVPASIKPSALFFSPHFQNPKIQQYSLSIEQMLPHRNVVTVGTLLSLARELPKFVDTNIDTTAPLNITYLVQSAGGPLPPGTYTGPFYIKRINPNYQRITEVTSVTNLNYWEAQLRWAHTSSKGVDFHFLYTYAKSVDGNPNETGRIGTNDPLDPMNAKAEIGRSNFDQRHALSSSATLHMPPLSRPALAKSIGGLSLAPVFYWRSGLPYSMRTFGAIPRENTVSGYNLIGLATGINGSGGDNRVPTLGRNIFHSPGTYNAHARLSDRWDMGSNRKLIAQVECYNLLNHQNVTRIDTNGYEITAPSTSTSLPVLTWQSGANGKTSFGRPYNSNSTIDYQDRRLQFGLRMEF